MNTITLITIVSGVILVFAILGDFMVNESRNKWSTGFNYIIALASTFIGITLGLYFADIDNEYEEKQNTIKYLEIALNDIETVQSMILDDYRKEASKYGGKETEEEQGSHIENIADIQIPIPTTVETIIKSPVYTKYIPSRLFHELIYCFHNSYSFKGAVETQKNASVLDEQQLLSTLKNYITLLSFNYFVIDTELQYLKGTMSDPEIEQLYSRGFDKAYETLKYGEWNEFLNSQLEKVKLNNE